MDNQAVEQQSALMGRQGVDLQVDGDTRLTGALIESSEGAVNLNGSRVVQQDLAGHRYQGSGKGEVPLSVGGLTGVVNKLVTKGELPLSVSVDSSQADSHSALRSKP